MIIDFRVRPPYASFLETDTFKRWRAYRPSGGKRPDMLELGRESVSSAEEGSLPLFFEEMDRAGISRCAVMGRTARGCVSNDDIARLVSDHPGRFIPFAGIDPLAPDAAAEAERRLDEGFRGICLEPGWCAEPLLADAPLLDPVFAVCAAKGGIAVISSGVEHGPDLAYADPNPIVHVAKKYPSMPVVVAHASWPFADMAVAACQIAKNLYLAPDYYFAIKDMPMAGHYLNAGNSFLKYRLLFSSSYPVRGLEQSVRAWASSGLRADVLERVMYANAAELLGLDG